MPLVLMSFDSDRYGTATIAKIFNGCDIAQIFHVVIELIAVDVIDDATGGSFTKPSLRYERSNEDVYHFTFDIDAGTKVAFIVDLKLARAFELDMTQYLSVATYLVAVLKRGYSPELHIVTSFRIKSIILTCSRLSSLIKT